MKTVVNVSVEKALSRLNKTAIKSAIQAHQNALKEPETITATTIRLKSPVVEFYRALADEMGISTQAVISILLSSMIGSHIDAEKESCFVINSGRDD